MLIREVRPKESIGKYVKYGEEIFPVRTVMKVLRGMRGQKEGIEKGIDIGRRVGSASGEQV